VAGWISIEWLGLPEPIPAGSMKVYRARKTMRRVTCPNKARRA